MLLGPPLSSALLLGVGKEGALPGHVRGMAAFIKNITDERRKEMAADAGGQCARGDLLSLFIKHANEKGKAHMLTDEYLRDMIINFMIAGRDTTSCLLTNLFKNLATNPGAEERLLREVSCALDGAAHQGDAASSSGSSSSSSSDAKAAEAIFDAATKRMPFADACVNETLRMYPPVGNDARFAVSKDVLPGPDKLEVLPDMMMMIPLFAIGRNPDNFKDPDAFLPGRWNEEEPAAAAAAPSSASLKPTKPIHRTHEYKMPIFWGGPRLCLGKDMARLEAKIVAAVLLTQYEIRPLPNLPDDDFVNGPVIFHKGGLPCRIFRR